ncbi:MAG TPA: L-threonylcarbamoyladenylate synthase [Methylophilaceae bacterium]|nr:L-threonylcarbamoyladenylate synthase [Methylophilaceae bacterium]
MSQYFVIHPQSPQPRLIHQIVEILRDGGVIVYPTDSSYALGCMLGNKDAQTRIRQIRDVEDDYHFTLICRNLTEIATYAQVDNSQFRLLKANTPGQYTFILKATRELPRRLQHPKRSTIGLRIPGHAVVQAILDELDEPLLSMTLLLPGDDDPLNEAWEIRERLEHQVDLVIDAGPCLTVPTTVVDLTGESPEVLRLGAGDPEALGLQPVNNN